MKRAAKKVKWGVLSTARIGINSVIPAIHESSNAEVVGIASRDETRAREKATLLSISKSYGSYNELIESDEVDAVYIPLPNNMHHDLTIAAAENGKHILCEKPLALNARECEEMISACQRNGVLLLEGFMYRFAPVITKLSELVRDGDIGKISVIRSEFTYKTDDPNDFRLQKAFGGGALYDLGCYCVSFSRLMTGSEPTLARAVGRFKAGDGVDDILVGMLEFPTGAVGFFDCGFQTGLRHSVEIIGDTGILRTASAFEPGFQPLITKQSAKLETITCEAANPYKLMIEHFSDCILTDTELRYSPADSLGNMRALDMLYQSASKNKTDSENARTQYR